MEKKLVLNQIVQAPGRGTLLFAEIGEDKKPVCNVAVSFTDPKEVAKFEQGKTYSITIAE